MSEQNRRAISRLPSSVSRQACDACRIRKTKCIARGESSSSGTSVDSRCQRCEKLSKECTYDLPQKTRGPRKRSAVTSPRESQPPVTIVTRPGSTPLSPVPPSPQTLVSIQSRLRSASSPRGQTDYTFQSINAALSPGTLHTTSPAPIQAYSTPNAILALDDHAYPTDSLCHRSLVVRMMHDYIDLLYPLIPVVHRPSFRKDLGRTRDAYDSDFLGLIIGLCAVTVGNLPSRYHEYRALNPPLEYDSRTDMIDHCYDLILSLRSTKYFDEINYQKWASSYLMAIAFFQVGNHNRARMVEVEAMQLARLLDLHQVSSYDGLNCIEAQLRKKAFWLMFFGYVHSQLQNLRKERLTFLDPSLLQNTELKSLLPAEIDDEMIFEHAILSPTDSRVCATTGFIMHSRVFCTALTSASHSPAASKEHCMCTRAVQPALQVEYLQDRLQALKYMLDDAPMQLRQWAPGRFNNGLGDTNNENSSIVAAQMEAMRANIHVTHLWLQSIILDQIDALQSAEPSLHTPDPKRIWPEREDICRQLLHVLHSLSDAQLEPNGYHMICKIRDVAVSLLNCPFEQPDRIAIRAHEYLRQFTDVLSRLDGSEIVNTLSLQSWVDTGRRP